MPGVDGRAVLADLPAGAHETTRARLLATIAGESRGAHGARGLQAAQAAEKIARRLNDPALLAFALNGVFMQTFYRAGLAPERDGRHGLGTLRALGAPSRVVSTAPPRRRSRCSTARPRSAAGFADRGTLVPHRTRRHRRRRSHHDAAMPCRTGPRSRRDRRCRKRHAHSRPRVHIPRRTRGRPGTAPPHRVNLKRYGPGLGWGICEHRSPSRQTGGPPPTP
jgi:hypothetical protein